MIKLIKNKLIVNITAKKSSNDIIAIEIIINIILTNTNTKKVNKRGNYTARS